MKTQNRNMKRETKIKPYCKEEIEEFSKQENSQTSTTLRIENPEVITAADVLRVENPAVTDANPIPFAMRTYVRDANGEKILYSDLLKANAAAKEHETKQLLKEVVSPQPSNTQADKERHKKKLDSLKQRCREDMAVLRTCVFVSNKMKGIDREIYNFTEVFEKLVKEPKIQCVLINEKGEVRYRDYLTKAEEKRKGRLFIFFSFHYYIRFGESR